MDLFFKKLIWLSLVLVLFELLFADSQPHWFLVTLALAGINVIALVGFRLIRRALVLSADIVIHG